MSSPPELDPRYQELMRRRNGNGHGTATLDRPAPKVRCRRCHLEYDKGLALCPWCDADPKAPPPPADDAPASKSRKRNPLDSLPTVTLTPEDPQPAAEPPRVRKPAPAPRLCACGGRVNTFNGKCARCDKAAPTTTDARPVRISATTEVKGEVVPDPAPEALEPPTHEAESASSREPPPDVPAGPGPRLCSRCEKRPAREGTTPKGRPYRTCVECHDTATRDRQNWEARQREAASSFAAAESASEPRRPAPRPASSWSRVDPEAVAFDAIVRALSRLDEGQRQRVMTYTAIRFQLGVVS